jgi:tRNA A37 threonylcarbamoyladenosine dehydratase
MRHALKVVASTEAPRRRAVIELNEQNKRSSYGTIITIPAIFGIYLANHVIMKLIE